MVTPGITSGAPAGHLLLWGLLICAGSACIPGIRESTDSTVAAAPGEGLAGGHGEETGVPPGDGPDTRDVVPRADPGPETDVLEARPPDLTIGAVLPVSGSPSLREYARLFIEGLEIGASLALQAGLRVELVVEDNQGTASGSVRGAAALAARGALAILGPLDAGNVRAAARAVPREMTFFSPTATQVPYGREGVYSIAAGDPEAGRTLARTVRELGYASAVVVHPRSPREGVEMDAFQHEFVSLGGVVRRRIRYPPGTTTFERYLQQVKSLSPPLLVVAAPSSDVELLAPQIAFFGLDEMDLQVAGTAGWTAPPVMERVAGRHTDGVIALSTLSPGAVREPPPDFVTAYESRFRRSLNSAVPLVGLDLLGMALSAHAAGARKPGDVTPNMEAIGTFNGVTGTYSFSDGHLTRRYHPVRILRGALHPLDAHIPPIPPSGHRAPGARTPSG